MMISRIREAIGPAVFASRFFDSIPAIFPARGWRSRSKAASASGIVPLSARCLARITASSSAMDAPWPAPAGCAASPISTILSL